MNNTYCQKCPIRLFNNKHYNLQGIGNPNYGNLIIIPNVDYSAYKNKSLEYSEQVKIIQSVLSSSTGEATNYYILPLLRCNEFISCPSTEEIINNCINYLAYDIKQYNFKHILVLGSAVNRLLHRTNITNNLNTIFISKNYRLYNVNYAPCIKSKNKKLYEVFKQTLLKWHNIIINKHYENYKFEEL